VIAWHCKVHLSLSDWINPHAPSSAMRGDSRNRKTLAIVQLKMSACMTFASVPYDLSSLRETSSLRPLGRSNNHFARFVQMTGLMKMVEAFFMRPTRTLAGHRVQWGAPGETDRTAGYILQAVSSSLLQTCRFASTGIPPFPSGCQYCHTRSLKDSMAIGRRLFPFP